MAPEYRLCQSCKCNKELDAHNFNALRDGKFSKTCTGCLKRRQSTYRAEKDKENLADTLDSDDETCADDDEDAADFINMSAVNLDAFLEALLERHDDIKTITARVDVSRLASSDMRIMADNISTEIWECMRYRFQYVPHFST